MPQLDFITYKHIGSYIIITLVFVSLVVSLDILPGYGFLIKNLEQIIYEKVFNLKKNEGYQINGYVLDMESINFHGVGQTPYSSNNIITKEQKNDIIRKIVEYKENEFYILRIKDFEIEFVKVKRYFIYKEKDFHAYRKCVNSLNDILLKHSIKYIMNKDISLKEGKEMEIVIEKDKLAELLKVFSVNFDLLVEHGHKQWNMRGLDIEKNEESIKYLKNFLLEYKINKNVTTYEVMSDPKSASAIFLNNFKNIKVNDVKSFMKLIEEYIKLLGGYNGGYNPLLQHCYEIFEPLGLYKAVEDPYGIEYDNYDDVILGEITMLNYTINRRIVSKNYTNIVPECDILKEVGRYTISERLKDKNDPIRKNRFFNDKFRGYLVKETQYLETYVTCSMLSEVVKEICESDAKDVIGKCLLVCVDFAEGMIDVKIKNKLWRQCHLYIGVIQNIISSGIYEEWKKKYSSESKYFEEELYSKIAEKWKLKEKSYKEKFKK